MMHPAAVMPLPQHRAARNVDAQSFFTAIYGSVAGWIELRAGVARANDLTKIDLVPIDQAGSWFAYTPAELPRLCADVVQLAAQYGNVYVSAHVYRRPRRDAEVKPGRVVVVDDAPLATACSFVVQTSPASGHAYYLLDQDTPADTLRDLSRRAATALDGDPSGADVQQLVRVPGTLNTKAQHGGAYGVALRQRGERRYSHAELELMWPIVTSLPNVDRVSIAAWHGNRADLLNDVGLPRRWKNPQVPGWRVLRSDLVPPSTSEARYIIISSLVTHGYPDAEIFVLARQFADFEATARKGSDWLDTDIVRCIAKARARYDVTPTPSRTRGTKPAEPLPVIVRARRGRTSTLTPAALLAFYEQERSCAHVVLLTVSAVAERLQVSRATVERCERVLRAEGQIERHCCNRRQASFVALQRPLTITEATQPTPRIDDVPRPDPVPRPLTNDAEHTRAGATHVPSTAPHIPQQEAGNVAERRIGGTHPSDGTPALFCPTPRTAIADAFDHFAQRPRVTRRMLVMFLDSKYPVLHCPPAALDRLIAAERQQRVWAQQVNTVRTMPYAQLQRLSRKLDRLLSDGPAGPRGGQYGWACGMVAHVNVELERRALMHARARIAPQAPAAARGVPVARNERPAHVDGRRAAQCPPTGARPHGGVFLRNAAHAVRIVRRGDHGNVTCCATYRQPAPPTQRTAAHVCTTWARSVQCSLVTSRSCDASGAAQGAVRGNHTATHTRRATRAAAHWDGVKQLFCRNQLLIDTQPLVLGSECAAHHDEKHPNRSPEPVTRPRLAGRTRPHPDRAALVHGQKRVHRRENDHAPAERWADQRAQVECA